jgi:hypothetical protein
MLTSLIPLARFRLKTNPPLDIKLRINVTMMCGCPIAPDQPWKPENYTVRAINHKPDGTREVVDLQFDPNAGRRLPQSIHQNVYRDGGRLARIAFVFPERQLHAGLPHTGLRCVRENWRPCRAVGHARRDAPGGLAVR